MKKRTKYLTLIILVIVIGLLSRYLGYPLWIGDILYGAMLYFLMRFIFVKKNKIHALYLSIILGIVIEVISVANFGDFNFIKNNILFKTVFGYAFSWEDIVFYVFGILPTYAFDKIFLK